MPNGEILNYFPNERFTIREAQKQALLEAEKALESGKKTIIIEAPTGVGKSLLSYTFLRYFGDGYVCTGTKGLQDQYLRDFTELLKVEGRGNFDCLERKDSTCDKGACQVLQMACERKPGTKETPWIAYHSVRDGVDKYWQQDPSRTVRCPYWKIKVDCLNNFAVVHNYSYILTESNFIGEFTPRKVLISDEGHNIESQLIDFIKLPITQNNLDIVNKFLNPEHQIKFHKTSFKMANFDRLMEQVNWVKHLNDMIPVALERINSEAKRAYDERSELEKQVHMTSNKAEIGERLEAKDKRLEDLYAWQTQIESLQKNQIAFFLKDIAESPANWVVKEEYEAIGVVSRIEFQPIRVSKYAQDYYFRLGEINIIMSATVLDYTRMASDLGLDLAETAYIKIPPQFPVENHKIFNLAWADFGYSKTETKAEEEEFYRQVVGRIDKLIDLFPDCRGIIHATSYPVASYIKRFSRHADGRLTFHGAKDRVQKLELHKEKKGSVLVSPSMTEGVDLKDDLSRFQILIKVPFPDTSDDRIKRRMEVDPLSYPYLTAKTIIQSIGRSVRSADDYAVTFCLDTRIKGFTYMNEKMMENYTRHFQSIEKLKELKRLSDKPELVKEFRSSVSRPKKEAEKAQKKAAYVKR